MSAKKCVDVFKKLQISAVFFGLALGKLFGIQKCVPPCGLGAVRIGPVPFPGRRL